MTNIRTNRVVGQAINANKSHYFSLFFRSRFVPDSFTFCSTFTIRSRFVHVLFLIRSVYGNKQGTKGERNIIAQNKQSSQ